MKTVLGSFRVKEGHSPYGLGVQSISKYCKSKGQDVSLLSLPLKTEEAVEEILRTDCSILGLGSNYVTESKVIEIVKDVKDRKKDMIVVLGGPSVTYSSKKSRIRKSNADIFVKGDGEGAFSSILKNPIAAVEGKLEIPGISTKENPNEEISVTDMNSLASPFPIDFETDHVYWETVRGCAFNCIYCAHPGQSKGFRNIPMGRVIKERDYLAQKKFRAVYITDPILGGGKARSKEILKLLKGLKGSFITAEYRPEYLDSETMDLLEDAEIGWLEFGLQTTNPDLGYFRKNDLSSLENLGSLSKRGIKYSLDLICGIPGDSKKSFEDSLRFAIEDAKPASLKVFPLRVYEGTSLEGMALENSWTFDPITRIIKRSGTFDEAELQEWMTLGRTVSQVYKFLESNNWLGEETMFRRLDFFKKCSSEFGKSLSEDYNERNVKMNLEGLK